MDGKIGVGSAVSHNNIVQQNACSVSTNDNLLSPAGGGTQIGRSQNPAR